MEWSFSASDGFGFDTGLGADGGLGRLMIFCTVDADRKMFSSAS